MKRIFDILISSLLLLIFFPLLVPVCILIWWQDRHSPFYVAARVGRGEKPFPMIKLRSMIINASKTGVDSTSANDKRITPVGAFVRRYKLDEIPQLLNVIRGDMSLVGPRPNVKRETDLYTSQEKRLLSVRPGVTDLASIVFADESDILKDSLDPDLTYNQLIRPWKSRLGLLYVEKANLVLDFEILLLTGLTLVSRREALSGIRKILEGWGADAQLIQIARRTDVLLAFPPPGATSIVTSRVPG